MNGRNIHILYKVMAWISIFVKKKKKAKKNLVTVILQSEMRYQLLQDKLTNIFTLIFSWNNEFQDFYQYVHLNCSLWEKTKVDPKERV